MQCLHAHRAVANVCNNNSDANAQRERNDEANKIVNAIDEVIIIVRQMFAANAQVSGCIHMLDWY